MKLKIMQCGEVVLRQTARPLSRKEIVSASVSQLIELMRETMRDAPGVGLAAPQIGLPLQLAVIEDRPEYTKGISPELLAERQRAPIPFHVIINPRLSVDTSSTVEFFEGCLSLQGFVALVPRAVNVRVECLNEKGDPAVLKAQGWYARILQHEIDHLSGTLYTDKMIPRSLMSVDNMNRYWKDKQIERIKEELGITFEKQ
jgi:peptide deformylase